MTSNCGPNHCGSPCVLDRPHHFPTFPFCRTIFHLIQEFLSQRDRSPFLSFVKVRGFGQVHICSCVFEVTMMTRWLMGLLVCILFLLAVPIQPLAKKNCFYRRSCYRKKFCDLKRVRRYVRGKKRYRYRCTYRRYCRRIRVCRRPLPPPPPPPMPTGELPPPPPAMDMDSKKNVSVPQELLKQKVQVNLTSVFGCFKKQLRDDEQFTGAKVRFTIRGDRGRVGYVALEDSDKPYKSLVRCIRRRSRRWRFPRFTGSAFVIYPIFIRRR